MRVFYILEGTSIESEVDCIYSNEDYLRIGEVRKQPPVKIWGIIRTLRFGIIGHYLSRWSV
jgi:hypothetical protein